MAYIYYILYSQPAALGKEYLWSLKSDAKESGVSNE